MRRARQAAAPRHEVTSILDELEPTRTGESVALDHGRRLEIERGAGGERIRIRGRGGDVILRVDLTEGGARLVLEAADLDISATNTLRLRGRDVLVEAERDLHTRAGGVHHARAAADARVEAARVEIQANDGDLGLRAREDIRADGEHVRLNDDPVPAPYPWSEPALEDARAY